MRDGGCARARREEVRIQVPASASRATEKNDTDKKGVDSQEDDNGARGAVSLFASLRREAC